MTTLKEIQKHIGEMGSIYVLEVNLTFQVTVLDVKQPYGRIRYLVTPVAGSGQHWTNAVTFTPKSVKERS